ncbi:MAG: hypothetical protein IKJ93_07110 [Clostridia bacterium]|nr:hypothetical protein [Clostridia bacterium]
MTKLFKNSKQVLALVFAFAVLAVSLFTGGANITANACDVSKVDYWDGTIAPSFAGGTGSETDPYIIKTAEQLARCCLGQNKTESKGKFYKVDDSVKIFVMQPESVVDLDTLLGLDSAEATKNYIMGLTGKINWLDKMNLGYGSFNGSFDGNGATIYGLYADNTLTNDANRDCGLFPRFDGGYEDSGKIVPNVCKNIAVKNSYYASCRRLGAISGASYAKGYGADVNGIIYYDTIAVVNCYMTTTGNINYYREQGIVVDGGAGDVSVLNNILVRGNYAVNTEQNKKIGVLAATQTEGIMQKGGAIVKPKLSNSVILGADPFSRDAYFSFVFMKTKDPEGKDVYTFFDNVITDQPAGKVTAETTNAEFAEEQVKQITATGFDFQHAATTLDWGTTWFMSEDGPELRKFHGTIALVQTKTTHVWECADCGLQSPGGVANHRFVCDVPLKENELDPYYCKDCGYVCQHNEQTVAGYEEGDCLTAPGTYSRCKFCPSFIATDLGTIPGHQLTYVEADPGDCATEGTEAYWVCTTPGCGRKYKAVGPNGKEITAAELKYAPFEDAVEDDDLKTGVLGNHVKKENADGSFVVEMVDEEGHYFICELDGGRLNSKGKLIGDDEVEKHDFENAKCKECGFVCENHNFKPTGRVIAGNCIKDEETEYKCTKCGWKKTEVTKEAGHNIKSVKKVEPTETLEGTKAHYKCDVCLEIYADAQGKTAVTKSSLIIPRTLNDEGYDNNVDPNPGHDDVVSDGENGNQEPGGTDQGENVEDNQNNTNDNQNNVNDNQNNNDDDYMQNSTGNQGSDSTGDNLVYIIAAIVVLLGVAIVFIRKFLKS